MKTQDELTRGSKRGSVLVVALLMVSFAIIGATAALRYCMHEWRLSRHSAARVQALHTAEAGVELAIYEFRRDRGSSGDGWSGWTEVSNGVYRLELGMSNMPVDASTPSSFVVEADTNTLTIVSRASAEVPRFADPTARAVMVTLETTEGTSGSPFEWGMLAKDQLRIVGNPFCDSYDSRNGAYGGTNISQNCNIGSMGARADAISGGGAAQVFGDAAVSSLGDVDASPGPFWTGDLHRDLDQDFPAVVPPRTDITDAALGNANKTINVAGDTYVGMPSVALSNKELLITGDGELILYIDGVFSINTAADMTLSPSAGGSIVVKLFLNGTANIKGQLNTGGIPWNLQIYGTETCTEIDCQANNPKAMAIYAPYAQINLAGNAAIMGAVVGQSIKETGTFDFHYDEALSDLDMPVDDSDSGDFIMKTWWEL